MNFLIPTKHEQSLSFVSPNSNNHRRTLNLFVSQFVWISQLLKAVRANYTNYLNFKLCSDVAVDEQLRQHAT